MIKRNRRFVALGLFAALTLGAGCTSSESPVGPSAASTAEAPELLLGGSALVGSTVGKVLSITDLLTCRALPYASTTRTIGPNGGVVAVGQYSLVIPAGALKTNVQIRAEQVSGKVNSVRFSPEGLKFARPATLTMGYENCVAGPPAQAHRLYERAAQGAGHSSDDGLAPHEDRHGADRPLLPVRRGVLRM